ncbi:hypothetical protein Tco_0020114 [Tanacetum coccineum]
MPIGASENDSSRMKGNSHWWAYPSQPGVCWDSRRAAPYDVHDQLDPGILVGVSVRSRRRFSDKSGILPDYTQKLNETLKIQIAKQKRLTYWMEILRVSHSFPIRRALSLKLMTWYPPPMQNSGKYAGTSFAFGLHAPRNRGSNIVHQKKRFISHAFLQFRDVKHTMNSTQPLWEFKTIGDDYYFGNDLKRSNITRVQLSLFAKTYHSLPWQYFQHDLISYLKLKRFSSYVSIDLLTIMGGLDTTLDLNYFLGRSSCMISGPVS